MTEEEWQADYTAALWLWLTRQSARKFRLLHVALLRPLLECLTGTSQETADQTLAAIERFVDTGKTKVALKQAREAIRELLATEIGYHQKLVLGTFLVAATDKGFSITTANAESAYVAAKMQSHQEYRHTQKQYIRDIFGNPFRPVAFDPAWRTATAVGLAQTMYDARHFNAMPILADALQDAGCEDETILGHCRDETQLHVRGCWVVDLVLGKS